MRISYRSGLIVSLATLGTASLVACGSDDPETTTSTTSTNTTDATTATGTGGATSTATGQGGASSTTAGQGGATTAAGTGGDMTAGAGGSMGQGGGGGSMPVPPKQAFIYWGDFATNGTNEIAALSFPDGMPKKITIPGVTKIDEFYDLAQSHDGAMLAMAFRADSGQAKVYVAPADGSGMPVVVADLTAAANTAANIELTNLSFSPDGKLVAFRADAATNGQHLVHVVPTDASNTAPKVVTPSPAAGQEASASVAWIDNTHLAVVGDLGTTDNVFNVFVSDTAAMMPALTAVVDPMLLNASTKAVKTGVQVGADGKIYFRSSHDTAMTYLYKADGDGKNVMAVAATASVTNAEITNFQLSPDGMSVAFGANEKADGNVQVYTAKLADMTATKHTAFTMAPATGKFYGPSSATNAIAWSPDGKMLAVIADWPLAMGDGDDDYVAFVVPTTGNPAPVRIANVSAAAMNMDIDAVGFTADNMRLGLLGDLVVNNDTEFYSTTDFATANQMPANIRSQAVVAGGDVNGFVVLR